MPEISTEVRIDLHRMRFEAIRELSRINPEGYEADLQRWLRESYRLEEGREEKAKATTETQRREEVHPQITQMDTDETAVLRAGRAMELVRVVSARPAAPARRPYLRKDGPIVHRMQELLRQGLQPRFVSQALVSEFGAQRAPSAGVVSKWKRGVNGGAAKAGQSPEETPLSPSGTGVPPVPPPVDRQDARPTRGKQQGAEPAT